MGAGLSSLIQNTSCASNLKRLWPDYVKITSQKVMGAGISSLIKHICCALNLRDCGLIM